MFPTGSRRISAVKLRALWIGYWVFIFVLTHVPVPPNLPPMKNNWDKIVHFFMYLGLVLLGGQRVLRRQGARAVNVFVLWAVGYALYGAFDEWSQPFVRRTMSFNDWLADAAGIVAATALLILWSRRRAPRVQR